MDSILQVVEAGLNQGYEGGEAPLEIDSQFFTRPTSNFFIFIFIFIFD